MNLQWQLIPFRLGRAGNPLDRSGLASFGRFRTVRQVYSRFRRLTRPGDLRFHPANVEARGVTISTRSETYFSGLSIEHCLSDLRTDGISQILSLPERVVDNILSYAKNARFRTEEGGESGLLADLQHRRDSGLLASARAICTDVTRSTEIMSILRDPAIRQIAMRYLGYQPEICETYLEILFHMPLGVDEPRYVPHNYHYDVPGFGFIAFFFYLNEVDEHSGAHVVIRQSHTKKPISLLLRSGQSAGKVATAHYAPELELTVRGPKGHGFVEDLYGFHKVLRPTHCDRLTLQIRYY